jgi:hypothetical protein
MNSSQNMGTNGNMKCPKNKLSNMGRNEHYMIKNSSKWGQNVTTNSVL